MDSLRAERPSPKKESKRTASTVRDRSSASGGAGCVQGIGWIGQNLRSVLFHKFAIPLCFLVRDGHLDNCPKRFGLWNYECENEKLELCGGVLEAALKSAKDSTKKVGAGVKRALANVQEPAFTNAVHQVLETSFSSYFHSETQAVVTREVQSIGGPEQVGKIDILLSCSDGSPLLVLEVGFSHKDWWEMTHQNSWYAVLKARDSFDKPFLFAVLTMENQGGHKEEIGINLGVFLVARKDAKNLRICLINRCSVRGLENCSSAFGNLIFACLNMSKWAEEDGEVTFSYLGPNCCKVFDNESKQHKVLRCYDTRCRKSHRSSSVYKKLAEEAGSRHYCETLFEMGDETIRNGVVPATDNEESGAFSLFKYEGRLYVIIVHYFEGNHKASKPECFVGPLDGLSTLHKGNVAHADVRGYNIVHSQEDDGESVVIDYDYAGPIGQHVYPQNYNRLIDDGERSPNAAAGRHVSDRDDWYALGAYIFDKHLWISRVATAVQEMNDLRIFFKLDVLTADADEVKSQVLRLRDFLANATANGWTVKPCGKFAADLNHMQSSGTSPNATASLK